MQTSTLKFSQRANLGRSDESLIKAMATAEENIFKHGNEAMAHPDYQSWREEGKRIRNDVLSRLGHLLEEFEDNAQKSGATVHWAVDAEAAQEKVLEIARMHGCKKIIKSKSMLTEEIELNPALEQAGLDVLETDLGEYVVQLSGGRPSHIIAPIIHMTANQISDLFVEKHKTRRTTDGQALVSEARAILRKQMLAADMGITGANFLVAKTGGVVIVTNEGNGRFCGQTPKVRVSIAGIEKVLPSMAELAMMLRLLPRAATGQQSSTYVSIGTGTRNVRRPEHHHIVLVDNGRSTMLAGKYREMLRCIRCGSCMNHCPVYKIAGGLSYNSVYSGPMGAVLSPNIFGDAHDELPHGATMCSACTVSCPVKIPLPDLMRNLREDQIDAGKEGLMSKALFALWHFSAMNPFLYRLVAQTGSFVLRKLANQNGVLTSLWGAGSWFAERDLHAPSKPPYQSN